MRADAAASLHPGLHRHHLLLSLLVLLCNAVGAAGDAFTVDIAPYPFTEGHEVRVQLTGNGTWIPTPMAPAPLAFQLAMPDLLQLRLYEYNATLDTDCVRYAAEAPEALGTYMDFGIAAALQGTSPAEADDAYITIVAPLASVNFVMCMRFGNYSDYGETGAAAMLEWEPVRLNWTENGVSTVTTTFTATASELYFNLPDPTAGQHAVLQLLRDDGGYFTYPPSECVNNRSHCEKGDALKLVPKGAPCTYESQVHSYLGTSVVTTNGYWTTAAAEDGLTEGSVAGGVGAFGTQYAIPMVDMWSGPGFYAALEGDAGGYNHTVVPPAPFTSHAYVYLELLSAVGTELEVCYSGVYDRKQRATAANVTMEDAPVWRKVKKCLGEVLLASGSCSSQTFAFAVNGEPLGWTMTDLTPDTYGTLVFDDQGAGFMNNLKSETPFYTTYNTNASLMGTTPAIPPPVAGNKGYDVYPNYWAPQGGDMFQLVPEALFQAPSVTTNARGRAAGTTSTVGCWMRDADATYGLAEDGAPKPLRSSDLRDDPALMGSDDEDATLTKLYSFSSVYVPPAGNSWYVCYRRTCNHPSIQSHFNCPRSSGYRRLPFHKLGRGSPPPAWLHLDDAYTPGVDGTAAAHKFTPGVYTQYDANVTLLYPGAATWYAQDLREGTWSPLVVEQAASLVGVNLTDYIALDARPWSISRGHARSVIEASMGTALRVVPTAFGCDPPSAGNITVEHWDGGRLECNSADAGTSRADSSAPWMCAGSDFDTNVTGAVVYYLTMPPQADSYRVCIRTGGYNWREVPRSTAAWTGDAYGMPTPFLNRTGWNSGGGYLTTTAAPDISIDYGTTPDDAQGGAEALFVVHHNTGSRVLTAGSREFCTNGTEGCAASADVLRLVPNNGSAMCDIHPGVWVAALADTHLSVTCPTLGSGAPATSGLLHPGGNNTGGSFCSGMAEARKLCGGENCTADNAMFNAYLASVVDQYDDVVHGGVGVGETSLNDVGASLSVAGVAGVIRLPAYDAASAFGNTYRVCYKQAGYSGWLVLSQNFTVYGTPDWRLTPLVDASQPVLGGQSLGFEFRYPSYLTQHSGSSGYQANATFHAKLVQADSGGVADSNTCLNAAGSLQSQPYGAFATAVYFVNATDHLFYGGLQSGASDLRFTITAPHAPGRYFLCTMVNGRLAYHRTDHVFDVRDSGVRWFVDATSRPIHGGLSLVNLVRCAIPDGGATMASACGAAATDATFTVIRTGGGTSAKLVKANDTCHEEAFGAWVGVGDSKHQSALGSGANQAAGSLHLADTDSVTSQPVLRATLPLDLAGADLARYYEYKVCVRTSFTVKGGAMLWVQVPQELTLGSVVSHTDGTPKFLARPHPIRKWRLHPRLAPAHHRFAENGIGVEAARIGIAGASTWVIDNPSRASSLVPPERVAGLMVETSGRYEDSTRALDEFKIVLAAMPPKAGETAGDGAVADPTTFGGGFRLDTDTAAWMQVGRGDCSNPPAEGVSNTLPECAGSGKCPKLETIAGSEGAGGAATGTSIAISAHLPMQVGRYLVCYRSRWVDAGDTATAPGVDTPWIAVPEATTMRHGLFAYPSYLGFDVGLPVGNASALHLTVTDLWVHYGAAQSEVTPGASWCAVDEGVANTGTPCITQNSGGFRQDLLTVVNATDVCEAPTVVPSGGARWVAMSRFANASVVPGNPNDLELPLDPPSSSGRYKICIYKAGEALPGYFTNVSESYVLRRGVVYQLPNIGRSALNGGGGSYYLHPNLTAGGADAVALKVTPHPSLSGSYDPNEQFLEWYPSTSAAFEAKLPPTSPRNELFLSYTPFASTRAPYGFTVEVMSAGGVPLGVGEHEIEVLRCASASAITDIALQCDTFLTPDEVDATGAQTLFDLINTADDAVCRHRDRPITSVDATSAEKLHGWPVNGLLQFMRDGRTDFHLHYVSTCPTSEFGCGVRFRARVGVNANGSPKYLLSAPQWLNVEQFEPNGLTIDGYTVTHPSPAPTSLMSEAGCVSSALPGEKLDCYIKECYHDEPCITRFQATRDGHPEYAPRFGMTLGFSKADYEPWGSQLPLKVENDLGISFGQDFGCCGVALSWERGGYVELRQTPLLDYRVPTTVVAVNVTIGSVENQRWARYLVRITRRPINRIQLTSVGNLEAGRGLHVAPDPKPPAPQFLYAPYGQGSLRAVDGSYLEAMVPYLLTFEAEFEGGGAVPKRTGALRGWEIKGSIASSAESKVLTVSPAFTEIYNTDPEEILKSEFKFQPPASFPRFEVRFRVYIADNTCSRFSASGGVGGCQINFIFSHFVQPLYAVYTDIITPVRIPASTILVETVQPSSRSHWSASEGIEVTVLPGTYVTSTSNRENFVYDEFHFGDVFALVNGPQPADGYTNRDGLLIEKDLDPAADAADECAYEDPAGGVGDCLIWMYRTRMLQSRTSSSRKLWGARWTMRGSLPCNGCEFTFHTTWGAGPLSHDRAVAEGATQRGTAKLTWSDDALEMRCPNVEVQFSDNPDRMYSAVFSLAVGMGVVGQPGVLSAYSQWWAFADTTVDLQHVETRFPDVIGQVYSLHTGTPGGTSSRILRARLGQRAPAVFENLFFAGSAEPQLGFAEKFKLKFRTLEGVRYGIGVGYPEGTHVSGAAEFACESEILLNKYFIAETKPRMTVKAVVGASPICREAANINGDAAVSAGCLDFSTTNDEFDSTGVSFSVIFQEELADGTLRDDPNPKNITIVPRGGPRSNPMGLTPSWELDPLTRDVHISSDITLDSPYNPEALDVKGGFTYTFGTANVLAYRPKIKDHVQDKERIMLLKYGSKAQPSVEKHPVREAQFDLCDSTWNKDGFEAVGTTCLSVRLWIVPASPSDQIAIWDAPVSGEKVRSAGRGCGGSTSFSELYLSAVAYFVPGYDVPSVAQTRYYTYNQNIRFSVELEGRGQYFIQDGDVAKKQLTADNGVVVSNAAADTLLHNMTTADLRVGFTFYGRDAVGSNDPRPMVVKGVKSVSQVALQDVMTTAKYWWVNSNTDETFTAWDLSPAVTLDDECPMVRYLQSHEGHYQQFRAGPPAAGWEFASRIMVGIPFPIQTVVRNTDGDRAWSFETGTNVRVGKAPPSGCNDGGELKVYRLRPSGDTVQFARTLYGSLERSWVAQDNGIVPSTQGVAVLWPVFSAECESCRLVLDLCFVGKNTSQSCLDVAGSNPDANPSDARPLFSERTKVTQPFSVVPAEADTVQVYDQVMPPSGELMVGTPLEINLKLVTENNGWTLDLPEGNPWKASYSVESRWIPSVTEGVEPSTSMRYGFGGFIAKMPGRPFEYPPLQGGCGDIPRDAFGNPPSYATVLGSSALRTLRFAYTRPCSRCEVWLRASLSKGDVAATRFAYFPLRNFDADGPGGLVWGANLPTLGDKIVYNVRTCGAKWIFDPNSPVAVRRRRPFALTIIHTDWNNNPVWEASRFVRQQAVVSPGVSGSGNGAGGVALTTSPEVLRPNHGSQTVRMQFSRACYVCKVVDRERQGLLHALTVLTDPTRIVAHPPYAGANKDVVIGGAAMEWNFFVYLADENGDRAYTTGGPTASAFHPRYSTTAMEPLLLGLKRMPNRDLRVAFRDNEYVLASLTLGEPGMTITSGENVNNGVTYPSLAEGPNTLNKPGTVIVSFPDNSFGVDVAVDFTLSRTDANGGSTVIADLPTHYNGDTRSPMIHISPPAIRMAVTEPDVDAEGPVMEGGPCQASMTIGDAPCGFTAYLVGLGPSTLIDGQWFVSAADVPGVAYASADCGDCGAAVVHPSTGAFFERGRANFKLSFVQANFSIDSRDSCKCNITVRPPPLLAQDGALVQTFEVAYTTFPLYKWGFDLPTPTFKPTKDPAEPIPRATVVPMRRLWMKLNARTTSNLYPQTDATRKIVWPADPAVRNVTLMADRLVPPGCFVCLHVLDGSLSQNPGEVTRQICKVERLSADGSEFELYGTFRGDAPECIIPRQGIENVYVTQGAPAANFDTLVVTIDQPAGESLWPVNSPHSPLAYGLTASLPDRATRAVVAGEGFGIQVAIVNEAGGVVRGEHQARVVLRGYRTRGDGAPEKWTQPRYARDPATGLSDLRREIPRTDGTAAIGIKVEAMEWVSVADRGIASFHIDANETTRLVDAQGDPLVSALGTSVHSPWHFDVDVYLPEPLEFPLEPGVDLDTDAWTWSGNVTAIGPVHIVRRFSLLAAVFPAAQQDALLQDQAGTALPYAATSTYQRLLNLFEEPQARTMSPLDDQLSDDGAASGTGERREGLERTLQFQELWREKAWGTGVDYDPASFPTSKDWVDGVGKGQVRWAYGTPFEMTIVAMDRFGTRIEHPEDPGAFAVLRLSFFAVPCLTIDTANFGVRPWVYSTCISDRLAECRYVTDLTTIPQCSEVGSDWSVNGTGRAFSFNLHRGRAQIPSVLSNDRRSGKGSEQERFLITVEDVKSNTPPSVANVAQPTMSFLYGIRMQKVQAVVPYAADSCVNTGAQFRCTRRIDDEELPLETVNPLKTFSFIAAVTDEVGDPVLAEMSATIRIRGTCQDKLHNAYLGNWSPVSEQLDIASPIFMRVTNGFAIFPYLQVTGACERMQLTVSCVSDDTGTRGTACNAATPSTVLIRTESLDPNISVPNATLQLYPFELDMGTWLEDDLKPIFEGLTKETFEEPLLAALKRRDLQYIAGVYISKLCAYDAMGIPDRKLCLDFEKNLTGIELPTRRAAATQQTGTDDDETLAFKAEYEVLTLLEVHPEALEVQVGTAVNAERPTLRRSLLFNRLQEIDVPTLAPLTYSPGSAAPPTAQPAVISPAPRTPMPATPEPDNNTYTGDPPLEYLPAVGAVPRANRFLTVVCTVLVAVGVVLV